MKASFQGGLLRKIWRRRKPARPLSSKPEANIILKNRNEMELEYQSWARRLVSSVAVRGDSVSLSSLAGRSSSLNQSKGAWGMLEVKQQALRLPDSELCGKE